MSAFFLAFLAALALTGAGREGVRVARLAAALGPGAGLFAGIAVSTLATTALAAWAGALLAPSLAPAARGMFVALALAVAAVELLVLRAPPQPAEPTRSTGAILLVLLASQLTDSTRLVIAALALATGDPWLAGAGGAAGSGAALVAAALAGPAWEQRLPLRLMSRGLSAILLLVALAMAAQARGLIG